MRFHHIGIACSDIDRKNKEIRELYSIKEETPVVHDENQQACVCMLTLLSGINLELVSGGPVDNLLKKEFSYYHICFEVEDLEKAISNFEKKGAILVSPPKPAILFKGKKVAFLYTTTGLVEFLEA